MDRTDSIAPVTRRVLWAVVGVLIAAWVLLWGFPRSTGDLWAWEIAAPMSALFLGSIYGAGAYYFASTLRAGRWSEMAIGTLAASVFAALMMLTTVLHWDVLNHGDAPPVAAASFWAWVIIYALSPIVVFALWVHNRQTDPGVQNDEPVIGSRSRQIAGLVAAAAATAGTILLVHPTALAPHWPWPLTPLTARVVGCCLLQLSVGIALAAMETRIRVWIPLLRTMRLASLLVLIGMLRAWPTLSNHPARDIMFGALVGSVLAGSVLLRVARTRQYPH